METGVLKDPDDLISLNQRLNQTILHPHIYPDHRRKFPIDQGPYPDWALREDLHRKSFPGANVKPHPVQRDHVAHRHEPESGNAKSRGQELSKADKEVHPGEYLPIAKHGHIIHATEGS
jgi:hypothetical protein